MGCSHLLMLLLLAGGPAGEPAAALPAAELPEPPPVDLAGEPLTYVGPVRRSLDPRPVWTFRSPLNQSRYADVRTRAYLYTVPVYPVYFVPLPVYYGGYGHGGYRPVPDVAIDLDLRLYGTR